MKLKLVWFFLAFFLSACSTPKKEVPIAPYVPNLANGSKIYQDQCKGCHDQGVHGAPSIKEPEEWDLQRLTRAGSSKQHQLMGYLRPTNLKLTEHEEKDALYFIQHQLDDRDKDY